MTRIFVTGATGFLGKRFVRALVKQDSDVEVYVLVRPKRRGGAASDPAGVARRDAGHGAHSDPIAERLADAGLVHPRIHAVPGDVTDPRGLTFQVKESLEHQAKESLGQDAQATPLPPMDEFWHIAGLTEFHQSKRDQLVAVNVEGTRHALALAERLGVRCFFHISTAFVAGICDGPVPEGDLLHNPVFRNPYEETKYAGERLVRESGLPWVIIRPSIFMGDSRTGETDIDKMVYGVIKTYHSLARLVTREWRARGGPPPDLRYYVKGGLDSGKNLICVDDVVRLMLAVRSNWKGPICNGTISSSASPADSSPNGPISNRTYSGGPISNRVYSTYHAVHSCDVTVGRLHELITEGLGIDYLIMQPDVPDTPDSKQRFVSKGVKVYEGYMMYSDPVFDRSRAASLGREDKGLQPLASTFDRTRAASLGGWTPVPMDDARLRFLINAYIAKLDAKSGIETATRAPARLDLSRLPDVQQFGSFTMAYDTMSTHLEAFRAPGIRGYLAYTVVEQTALVFGDPVSDQPEALLHAFTAWLRSQALNLCALQVHRNTALTLRAAGFAVNKMGIETFVDLNKLQPQLRGNRYENLRNYCNIGFRNGIRVVEHHGLQDRLAEVKRISTAWMRTKKNRSELRILVREISTDPEPGVRHVFAERDGRLLGFIFFNPVYEHGQIVGYLANIERYDLDGWDLPPRFNAMRFIAFQAAPVFQAEGMRFIALGLSPLHEVAQSEFNDNPDLTRLFEQIYDESELYAFKGIATHKRLYPDRWEEPVYIVLAHDTATEDVLNIFKGVGLLD